MTSAEVHCVSTTKVRPASYIDKFNDNNRRIDLNPWDLAFLRSPYMQRGLLFTKPQSVPKQEEETNNNVISDMISHLKTSLSTTLDHFFPLAGRLGSEKHEDDNKISVYINCNSEGAEFVHATAGISIEDIMSPIYTPQNLIDSFFTLNGVLNYEGQSHPLLSIQVTELLDGVFIGCSINHSVCDGTSLWHFINSWSEASRISSSDSYTPSRPPVFERWFIKDTDCPIRLPASFVDEFPAVKITSSIEVLPLKGHVERCFHFTKSNILKLKEKANSEIVSEAKQNTVISSLQALLAHVWGAVTRARICLKNDNDENGETLVGFIMNIRGKLIPPLPEEFFGSALSWGSVTVKDGELLEKGFGYLASLLNQAANSHSFAKTRCLIESWIEKPFFPKQTDLGLSGSSLVARSSQRFNMYGNDFGWGRPIATKTGSFGKSYGITTVCPGSVEGSIDIEICLPMEIFTAMEKDIEFMEAF